jgi:hypothetical protein
MKKSSFAAAIFLLAVAALIFFLHSKKSAPAIDGATNENHPVTGTPGLTNPAAGHSLGVAAVLSTVADVASNPPPESPADKAGQFISETNPITDLPAATVLQNVRHAIRQYGEMFGGDPVGLNSEITAALAGQNPKHINFIDPAAGMRINAAGEMVDAWGTPYFFHQISGSEMEIHSAGPDKILWTSDDLISK